nr:MAG TPA: hypothetical protein [Bacteriophage sp.]
MCYKKSEALSRVFLKKWWTPRKMIFRLRNNYQSIIN